MDAYMSQKADAAELAAHTENSTIHITSSERTKWNDVPAFPLAVSNGGTGATASAGTGGALANLFPANLGTGIEWVSGWKSNWAEPGAVSIANLISLIAAALPSVKYAGVTMTAGAYTAGQTISIPWSSLPGVTSANMINYSPYNNGTVAPLTFAGYSGSYIIIRALAAFTAQANASHWFFYWG
jgi:hypothetical protein